MMGRRPNLDDLDREMREHIEAETEELVARGLSPADARAAALRKFGNPVRVKEDVRAVWVPGWLDQLRQDARDALRHLRRNPAFSLAVIVTLALGIGLTTAIYSVVNAVLIRPLSYPNPDRVVWLTTVTERSRTEILNDVDFADWRAGATTFEQMVAYDYTDATLAVDGEAERLSVVSASDGFWELAGAHAVLGALPRADEPDILVLSHRYFHERFGGDASVVGRAITLNGRPSTIGGVLPEGFAPQLPATVWRPSPQLPATIWRPSPDRLEPDVYSVMVLAPPNRSSGPDAMVRILLAIAQLKPGVTLDQARAELQAIQDRHHAAAPRWYGKASPRVVPLDEQLLGPSRFALAMLLAAAACVLLITCANVAGLLLSRASVRQKEIALRMSVGSGPLRVVRLLLAENLLHAFLGGAAGVLLASWLVRAVIELMGPAVPRLTETTIDPVVLLFAVAVSVGTALVFGIGPAVALCRTNVQEVLKDGVRTASASRARVTAGRLMVAAQVALTVVLLVGAGLMFKSVWRMTSYPAGFEPERILTLRVNFTGPQYRDQRARQAYAMRMLDTARGLPGVRDAAITRGNDSSMVVREEGQPAPEVPDDHRAVVTAVSPAFPRLMGMTLVRGRTFEEQEPSPAVLVNDALARRVFGTRDPIGRRINMPFAGPTTTATIVGVVSDVQYSKLDTAVTPEALFHHADVPLGGISLMLRIDGDPMDAAPAVRQAVAALDPSLAVHGVRTMEMALTDTIAPRRFNLLLLATFAGVALVLAILGVYGVVAYAVSARTHEIGIRLALGAHRARVVRMIVAQGMGSVVVGILVGLLAALMATRLIAGLLYGVEATDASTFALSTVVLTAVAFMACCVPALRAALVDPVRALRAE